MTILEFISLLTEQAKGRESSTQIQVCVCPNTIGNQHYELTNIKQLTTSLNNAIIIHVNEKTKHGQEDEG